MRNNNSRVLKFKSASGKSCNTSFTKSRASILEGGDDWEVMKDSSDNQILFPPEITQTALRPDIIVWSRSLRRVILMELTIPAEDNLQKAHNRKMLKYQALVEECRKNGWVTNLFPVEIGTRGFVYHSVGQFLRSLGLDSKSVKEMCALASITALRGSYTIYLSRKRKQFGNWTLYRTTDMHKSWDSGSALQQTERQVTQKSSH